MRHRVVFAPEARTQLISIYNYIARQTNPDLSFVFATSIVDYCESFTTFPYRGTRRDDLRLGLRTIGFRKRVTIAFDVEDETITIIGVFYGGQDMERRYEAKPRDDVSSTGRLGRVANTDALIWIGAIPTRMLSATHLERACHFATISPAPAPGVRLRHGE